MEEGKEDAYSEIVDEISTEGVDSGSGSPDIAGDPSYEVESRETGIYGSVGRRRDNTDNHQLFTPESSSYSLELDQPPAALNQKRDQELCHAAPRTPSLDHTGSSLRSRLPHVEASNHRELLHGETSNRTELVHDAQPIVERNETAAQSALHPPNYESPESPNAEALDQQLLVTAGYVRSTLNSNQSAPSKPEDRRSKLAPLVRSNLPDILSGVSPGYAKLEPLGGQRGSDLKPSLLRLAPLSNEPKLPVIDYAKETRIQASRIVGDSLSRALKEHALQSTIPITQTLISQPSTPDHPPPKMPEDTQTLAQGGKPVKKKTKMTKKFVKDIKQRIHVLNCVDGDLQSCLDEKNSRRIDFVLVYTPIEETEKELQRSLDMTEQRDKFKAELERLKFCFSEETIQMTAKSRKTFLKLHCDFDLLCETAEAIKLELPLADCETLPEEYYYSGISGKLMLKFQQHFATEDDEDFVSAPFIKSKGFLFEGWNNPDTFFRTSLRSLMVERILNEMDIRTEAEVEEEGRLKRRGMKWFLHRKYFEDYFILHDESSEDPLSPKAVAYFNQKLDDFKRHITSLTDSPDRRRMPEEKQDWTPGLVNLDPAAGARQETPPQANERVVEIKIESVDEVDGSDKILAAEKSRPYYYDSRKDLHFRWANKFMRSQPLNRIRNYFGEKIGLYFAWTETMIVTLWVPMIIGILVFIYGLTRSVIRYRNLRKQPNNSTEGEALTDEALEILEVVNTAVDNDITPYYSLLICLWATVFLELWKRTNARLKYEWDVNMFDEVEPDRPQFKGEKEINDPITGEIVNVFPFTRKLPRFLLSVTTVLFLILVVIGSTLGVIIYRAFAAYTFRNSAINTLLLSTIAAAIMNAIAIQVLERVYKFLAYKLTDWENHRTQSDYDNQLVAKLFTFYFINSYASLFYIAFMRGASSGGVLGLGKKFADQCANDNCMSELSFQVLVLMAAKPVPKFAMDVVLPWVLDKAKAIWFRCGYQKVTPADQGGKPYDINVLRESLMVREYLKPGLKDFTLEEYTEKTIQFGFQVLFAPSLPLGPLIAIVFLGLDIRIDARRMLWWYRRPIAYIAADIGTWFAILEFITYIGVIVNACVIAFTSNYGKDESLERQLIIVLVFEHVVFAVKFALAYIIPDTPDSVKLAFRKEHYEVQRKMEEADRDPQGLRRRTKYRPYEEICSGKLRKNQDL